MSISVNQIQDQICRLLSNGLKDHANLTQYNSPQKWEDYLCQTESMNLNEGVASDNCLEISGKCSDKISEGMNYLYSWQYYRSAGLYQA